jgi:hypothetical protein
VTLSLASSEQPRERASSAARETLELTTLGAVDFMET